MFTLYSYSKSYPYDNLTSFRNPCFRFKNTKCNNKNPNELAFKYFWYDKARNEIWKMDAISYNVRI